jgi:hypothetical protein
MKRYTKEWKQKLYRTPFKIKEPAELNTLSGTTVL